MARPGISRDQVLAAIDGIVGEGGKPQVNSIRAWLGNTGCPNTIHRYLREWRETRPVAATTVHELPQALTSAIASEIEKAAAKARAEKEEELATVKEEAFDLATAGEMLESERDSLAEQVVVLTTERDTLKGKAAQQEIDLNEAQRRIEREQQAAEAARAELAKAQFRSEDQAERLAEQITEVARIREELAKSQEGRISAEQQAAVLVAKLEAVVERAARAETRAEQVEQQGAKAAAAYEEARDRAAKDLRQIQLEREQDRERSVQEIRQVQAERDEARKAVSEARERAAAAIGRLEEIERKEKSSQSEKL